MATKTVAKTPLKPHASIRLLGYVKKQSAPKTTLHEIQTRLSGIGISLSKRVMEDRDKR